MSKEHYTIAPLQVELGIRMGEYQNVELPWLRCWDLQGNLLLSGDETEQERQKGDRACCPVAIALALNQKRNLFILQTTH